MGKVGGNEWDARIIAAPNALENTVVRKKEKNRWRNVRE